MSDFDLDLRNAEQHLEETGREGDIEGDRVVLGVLDGTTSDEEWLAEIDAGNVLMLAIEGDLNELAAGFAREVRDAGGTLMHFRRFLVVAPPDVTVDSDRLQ
ncbi:MAG: DUF5779 family protein [Halodesulfurarchaeum sp.]